MKYTDKWSLLVLSLLPNSNIKQPNDKIQCKEAAQIEILEKPTFNRIRPSLPDVALKCVFYKKIKDKLFALNTCVHFFSFSSSMTNIYRVRILVNSEFKSATPNQWPHNINQSIQRCKDFQDYTYQHEHLDNWTISDLSSFTYPYIQD